jgi:hypothetical protein
MQGLVNTTTRSEQLSGAATAQAPVPGKASSPVLTALASYFEREKIKTEKK